MRPTKVALIKKVCPNEALYEYPIPEVLSSEHLAGETALHTQNLIYSIVPASQVDYKLFLTSHQFTNVVGTDIYIYIGNSIGQKSYGLILSELSDARRLDEKISAFLREAYPDTIVEIDTKEIPHENILQTILSRISSTTNNELVFTLLSESQLNFGLGDLLIENHFSPIGDSHVFIYKNIAGENMIARLLKEAFISQE